jgi:hypothetical protein
MRSARAAARVDTLPRVYILVIWYSQRYAHHYFVFPFYQSDSRELTTKYEHLMTAGMPHVAYLKPGSDAANLPTLPSSHDTGILASPKFAPPATESVGIFL